MYVTDWTSILPPVLAIVLAIISRQVIPSLGIGIWVGFCLVESVNPVSGIALAIEGVVNVFSDPGDTRVLIFTLLIGGLIATIEKSGGVRGFIRLLEERSWVDSARRAKWLAYFTGIVVFIESNMTLLVAGAISRPLFDRYKVSRDELAYIIDSTSAPVCIMIPLNAWGAIILSLLASSAIDNPIDVFVSAIAFNLYPIIVILFSAFVISRDIKIGPMRQAQARTEAGEVLWPNATPMVDPSILAQPKAASSDDKARYMIVPILVMVVAMPLSLYITGEGAGHGCIRGAISPGHDSTDHVAAPVVPYLQLHRILHWLELGYLRHHDSPGNADCPVAGVVHLAVSGGGSVRLGVWRSCLTHQRYHGGGFDGVGNRPYRSCQDAIALCGYLRSHRHRRIFNPRPGAVVVVNPIFIIDSRSAVPTKALLTLTNRCLESR